MINKGMDVKQLVNSQLLYPEILMRHSLFSDIEEALVFAYNGELEDLEHIDLSKIFTENTVKD